MRHVWHADAFGMVCMTCHIGTGSGTLCRNCDWLARYHSMEGKCPCGVTVFRCMSITQECRGET